MVTIVPSLWSPFTLDLESAASLGYTERSYLEKEEEPNLLPSPFSPQVWDLETHGCCCTVSSKASGIKGELTACLYLPGPRALCVATGTLAFLHLKVG